MNQYCFSPQPACAPEGTVGRRNRPAPLQHKGLFKRISLAVFSVNPFFRLPAEETGKNAPCSAVFRSDKGPGRSLFAAAIRPERASFSRRAAGGCPNLSAPALPPSAEHGTGFGTTASFHCCAVLTQLPVTTRRKQCGKRAHQPGFQRFPATASRSGLFRPCPFPMLHFPRTRTSAPASRSEASAPKSRRSTRPARRRTARCSSKRQPPEARIMEPAEKTRRNSPDSVLFRGIARPALFCFTPPFLVQKSFIKMMA